MSPAPWGGAILDVDGTLLESNDAHASAYADALAEEGMHVPREKIRHFIGMGGDKLPARRGIDPHFAMAWRATRQKREIFAARYLPELHATRGARDPLDPMRARGLRVEAAKRAGVPIIALRCRGWSEAELAGADAVYADPADLLSQFDESLSRVHGSPAPMRNVSKRS